MLGLIRVRVVFHVLVSLIALAAATGVSAVGIDFECGLGDNNGAIGASYTGLAFSTISGGEIRYADITSGCYSVTSDNGMVYGAGEYFLSGNVAAYVANLGESAKISFTRGTASYFTVGYSSQFAFTVEAYDIAGILLTSATSATNTRSQGGTALVYQTVSHPGISYVILHDQGGHWMIDNLSTDAPVPEPASMTALGLGVAYALAGRRRRIR